MVPAVSVSQGLNQITAIAADWDFLKQIKGRGEEKQATSLWDKPLTRNAINKMFWFKLMKPQEEAWNKSADWMRLFYRTWRCNLDLVQYCHGWDSDTSHCWWQGWDYQAGWPGCNNTHECFIFFFQNSILCDNVMDWFYFLYQFLHSSIRVSNWECVNVLLI